jgi:TPP-dependent pyruvate/acetoin dehydrogenase alpha subunit
MPDCPSSALDLNQIPRNQWLAIYRTMCRARLTEQRMIRLYHQGKIFGGVYTGFGHEAIGAGTAHAGGDNDLFTPCIRDLTVHLARGLSVLDVFRQFLARVTGPTRGRDGNVHYGRLDQGVYAMISHLGAMIAVAVGGVMVRRRQGLDAVAMAYVGDGATSTGDFHEAVNYASVFDVPLLVVIENNQFAYSTPNSRQYRCKDLIDRAPGYGIEGVKVDGNDAVAVHLKVLEIVKEMRQTPRPVLLECDTLRIRGHGEHDDAGYIPEALKAEYAARDPLDNMRRSLTDGEIATDQDLETIDSECQKEIDDGYQQALAEPMPDPATLLDGVYAE